MQSEHISLHTVSTSVITPTTNTVHKPLHLGYGRALTPSALPDAVKNNTHTVHDAQTTIHSTPIGIRELNTLNALAKLSNLLYAAIAVKKNKRKKRGARTTLGDDAQNVARKEQTTSREPDTPIGIRNYVRH